jgi:hypothetical protein
MKSDLDTLIEELEAGALGRLSSGSAAGNAQSSPLDRETSKPCWHCGGSGVCGCSICGVMKPLVVWATGGCVACNTGGVPVQ